jgi:hypothetical protein
MVRVSVQLPHSLKAKLGGLCRHGTSISWFIRRLVNGNLAMPRLGRKDDDHGEDNGDLSMQPTKLSEQP